MVSKQSLITLGLIITLTNSIQSMQEDIFCHKQQRLEGNPKKQHEVKSLLAISAKAFGKSLFSNLENPTFIQACQDCPIPDHAAPLISKAFFSKPVEDVFQSHKKYVLTEIERESKIIQSGDFSTMNSERLADAARKGEYFSSEKAGITTLFYKMNLLKQLGGDPVATDISVERGKKRVLINKFLPAQNAALIVGQELKNCCQTGKTDSVFLKTYSPDSNASHVVNLTDSIAAYSPHISIHDIALWDKEDYFTLSTINNYPYQQLITIKKDPSGAYRWGCLSHRALEGRILGIMRLQASPIMGIIKNTGDNIHTISLLSPYPSKNIKFFCQSISFKANCIKSYNGEYLMSTNKGKLLIGYDSQSAMLVNWNNNPGAQEPLYHSIQFPHPFSALFYDNKQNDEGTIFAADYNTKDNSVTIQYYSKKTNQIKIGTYKHPEPLFHQNAPLDFVHVADGILTIFNGSLHYLDISNPDKIKYLLEKQVGCASKAISCKGKTIVTTPPCEAADAKIVDSSGLQKVNAIMSGSYPRVIEHIISACTAIHHKDLGQLAMLKEELTPEIVNYLEQKIHTSVLEREHAELV